MDVVAVDERGLDDALLDEWDRLAVRSSPPSIYNTPTYTLASWRHFDRASDLIVMVVRDGGRLVGLLPLRLRRRLRGAEVLLEAAATVEVDRVSLVAEPGAESRVWRAVLPRIAELKWDAWHLAELTEGSPLHAELDRWCDEHDLTVAHEPAGDGLIIDLPSSWEEFIAAHKSFRKRFKRFERDVPDYAIDRFRTPETILDGLAIYRSIHAQSWKAGRIGVFRTDRVTGFIERVMPQLAAEGRTTVRVLRAGCEPLAADITHRLGPVAYLHSAVYTEAAGHHSPGTMFTGLVLNELREEGATRADLLTGHADYLRAWASEIVPSSNVVVARQGVKRSMVAGARTAATMARSGRRSIVRAIEHRLTTRADG